MRSNILFFLCALCVLAFAFVADAQFWSTKQQGGGEGQIYATNERGERVRVHVKDADVSHEEPSIVDRLSHAMSPGETGQQHPGVMSSTTPGSTATSGATSGGLLHNIGEKLGLTHEKTTGEKMQDMANEYAQRAREVGEEYLPRGSTGGGPGMMEGARQTAAEYAQAAKEAVGSAQQRLSETAQSVRDTASGATASIPLITGAGTTGGGMMSGQQSTPSSRGGAISDAACKTASTLRHPFSSFPVDLSGFSMWPFRSSMMRAGLTANADVKETPAEFRIHIDCPGVNPNSIHVVLDKNILSVEGSRDEQEESEGEHYHLYEREYGDFKRTFRLPEGVLDVKNIYSTYQNGVLEVHLPKLHIVGEKVSPMAVPVQYTETGPKKLVTGKWRLPFLG